MNSNLYVCQTVYHLYLTLLLCDRNASNIIILTDFTKSLFGFKKDLMRFSFVESVFLFANEEFESGFRKGNVLSLAFDFMNYKRSLCKKINIFYPEIIKFKPFNNIYLFVDKSYLARYFMLTQKNIVLLDDGEGVYFDHKVDLKYIIRHYFFGIPKGRGLHKSISNVRVRYPEKFTKKHKKKIVDKLHLLDVPKYESMLTFAEKNKILNLFDLQKITRNDKVCLLFTQPFSEDGFISENEKIEMYDGIIKKYNLKGYKIYIKPHPRELSDYESLYHDVVVLNRDAPSECFNLLGGKFFNLGLAIQSTALSNARYIEERIELGYDLFPELKKGKERKDAIKIL